MAHFAELDSNNRVIRVVVVSNNELLDSSGTEHEHLGVQFCQSLFGGHWKQASYNTWGNTHAFGGTPFRKNYAGIGYTFDEGRDAFIPPKPFPSWLLNEETCRWEPPTPYPSDGKRYVWNENKREWEQVVVHDEA